ncbi:MAG: LptF/LptG family permease [Spirochaetaceae bacterium]|jgi:lipopolysaccharide export system permease protein|nr:LptF/LptG family permease [Spirochaetaceae bacterium]GMO20070.1 MAG: LptF/LptG family permease [Termitinemataceae bacterium]
MTIDRYLVKHFIPVFFLALTMFITLVLLIDLFVNLVNYLNNEASFKDIMMVSYYYIPKGISYSIPVSLLFAVAFTLGDLYAKNELTSIVASGIPFWRFTASLLVIGLLFSFFSFYFEDKIVIQTVRIKNEMSRKLKRVSDTDVNTNVVLRTNNGKRIYAVDFFDYQNITLNGVDIVDLDDSMSFSSRLRSNVAIWNGEYWNFSNPIIYRNEKDFIRVQNYTQNTEYNAEPELFRRHSLDPADLPARDAKSLVNDLITVGLPHYEALSDYYHRYSFSVTSLIVVILSLSMGGRFRKNILLMSLLASLGTAVIYYVMDLISMMMARLGYIPPVIGAWFPVIFFIITGSVLLRYSKT